MGGCIMNDLLGVNGHNDRYFIQSYAKQRLKTIMRRPLERPRSRRAPEREQRGLLCISGWAPTNQGF